MGYTTEHRGRRPKVVVPSNNNNNNNNNHHLFRTIKIQVYNVSIESRTIS